ncbi:hypothetical protein C1H46_025882 [Malus baccata]|uniref:Uncharacterized protein n=1 Tax=Malus baccata TaxID=106549 RepID=A0A540LQ03_MALBA|nr:hypothetical protein C1H46_025882 [Malus baccata]
MPDIPTRRFRLMTRELDLATIEKHGEAQHTEDKLFVFRYPGINNVAGVLYWLKHSRELKYRSLYLFLNPGISGLRKKWGRKS